MAKQPHLLEELTLEEVSAVERGANKGAKILFTKTVDESGCDKMENTERANLLKTLAKYLNMDIADLVKSTKPDEEHQVNKDLEALQKQNATLAANQSAMMMAANAITDAVAAITKAADAPAIDALVTKAKADITAITKDLDDENVVKYIGTQAASIDSTATARKGDMTSEDDKKKMDETRGKLPESMKKAFDEMSDADKMEFAKTYNAESTTDGGDVVSKTLDKISKEHDATKAELATLKARQEKDDIRKEFKDLDGKIDIAKFVDTVIVLRKSGDTGADDYIEQTRALVKQAEAGGNLFAQIGKKGDGSDDAETAVAKHAAEIKKVEPTLTDAQAIAKAYAANPSLYDDYLQDNPAQRS